MTRMLVGCLLLFLGSAAASASTASLTAVDALLERASKALQETNYKGRLTYEFGTVLETLEVVHAVKDGVEIERIQHLNGVEREFIRTGRSKDCVSVGNYLLRGGLADSDAGAVTLSHSYHFYIHNDERYADRTAVVVQLVPKDEFRYGMTLAIDRESGLPLMSLITSDAKNALERFQFVHLDVDVPLSEMDLEPGIDHFGKLDGAKTQCHDRDYETDGPWKPTWLPAGFLLSEAGSDAEHGEYLTFSDGLSSFSLFIAPVEHEESVRQGVARRGATLAVMSVGSYQRKPYSVILVGEVPLITAERVVASLRRRR